MGLDFRVRHLFIWTSLVLPNCFVGCWAGLCDELLLAADFNRGHEDTGMGVALSSPSPPDPMGSNLPCLIPRGDKTVTIPIP
jgi:hypothetical protein